MAANLDGPPSDAGERDAKYDLSPDNAVIRAIIFFSGRAAQDGKHRGILIARMLGSGEQAGVMTTSVRVIQGTLYAVDESQIGKRVVVYYRIRTRTVGLHILVDNDAE
jgi:hypothetical protein